MSEDQENAVQRKSKTLAELVPTETDEVIDSIAILLGMSLGDVRAGINNDRFEKLAIQALRAFRKKHYASYLGDLETSEEEPDMDMSLLLDSLESVQSEIDKTDNRDYKIQLERERHEIKEAIRRLEKENEHSAKLRDTVQ